MKFLRVNKSDNSKNISDYPRNDKKPIYRLDPDIEYYVLVENPVYNQETQEISVSGYELTEEYHEEYTHLKIANQLYNITDKPIHPDPIPVGESMTQSQYLIRQL
jgi:hypothetical protein